MKAYKELLWEPYRESLCTQVKIGLSFGISQFSVFAIFAAVFFFGGIVIEMDFPDAQPEDVFIAIFSIMFSA